MKVFSTEPTKCYNWIYTISKNAQEYLHYQKQYVFLKAQYYFALWTLGSVSKNCYWDQEPCEWWLAMGQEGRGKRDGKYPCPCLLTPTQVPVPVHNQIGCQVAQEDNSGCMQWAHLGLFHFSVLTVHHGREAWSVVQSQSQWLQTYSKGKGLLLARCVPERVPAALPHCPAPFPWSGLRGPGFHINRKKSQRVAAKWWGHLMGASPLPKAKDGMTGAAKKRKQEN